MLRRHKAESRAFLLHRLTTPLLLAASLLLVSKQLLGYPIVCSPAPADAVSTEFLAAYCYAGSTHSVLSAYQQKVGTDVPHPGISASEDESDYVYRYYYQYVYIVLVIQAVLFYVPHMVWLALDNGYLKRYFIVIDQSIKDSVLKKNRKLLSRPSLGLIVEIKYKKAVRFISKRLGSNTYFVRYLLCEILSVANLMLQVFLLELFLDGHFLDLGPQVYAHWKSPRNEDPVTTFPIVTNCFFRHIGPPGTMDDVEATCVLPNNPLHVKIFLFIWWWFALLFVVSSCSLLHHLLCAACLKYRLIAVWFECTCTNLGLDTKNFKELVKRGRVGDLFILICIKSHMDDLIFSTLLEELKAYRDNYRHRAKIENTDSLTSSDSPERCPLKGREKETLFNEIGGKEHNQTLVKPTGQNGTIKGNQPILSTLPTSSEQSSPASGIETVVKIVRGTGSLPNVSYKCIAIAEAETVDADVIEGVEPKSESNGSEELSSIDIGNEPRNVRSHDVGESNSTMSEGKRLRRIDSDQQCAITVEGDIPNIDRIKGNHSTTEFEIDRTNASNGNLIETNEKQSHINNTRNRRNESCDAQQTPQ